ncbi:hypothetical protein Phi48:2_gp13 [Cellulophaga phage phi48:2]|uniref:hypothetical protein n=1 Tax=Cellulophaga phage phi48:2 TaxID=1327968 RepID=UPI000351662B|nr:hypothetical protein Phi48:2_gp13 [Cellulophaga phage phi48:2]AGO47261.1 hypothetical protein Phi48:2_gp13 [Cellulophaga phage phi48:2]
MSKKVKLNWVVFKKTSNAIYLKSPLKDGGFKYMVKKGSKVETFENYKLFLNR